MWGFKTTCVHRGYWNIPSASKLGRREKCDGSRQCVWAINRRDDLNPTLCLVKVCDLTKVVSIRATSQQSIMSY